MTVTTRQFRVFAEQIEIRVSKMVETGVVPVAGVMAACTIAAAEAVMRVVFSMAVEAGRRWTGESPVFVAVQTSGISVLTQQCVVGDVVIELNG